MNAPITNLKPSPELNTLTEDALVQRIKDELKEIEDTEKKGKESAKLNDRTVLRHAVRLGELLIHAKSRSGQYGKWGDWLKKNFELTERTARRYVELKEGWPKVEDWLGRPDNKTVTVSDLSFRKAMKIIKAPATPTSTDTSDGYDNIEKRLVKKLEKMTVDTAEATVAKTIEQLKKVLGDMKAAAFESMKKNKAA